MLQKPLKKQMPPNWRGILVYLRAFEDQAREERFQEAEKSLKMMIKYYNAYKFFAQRRRAEFDPARKTKRGIAEWEIEYIRPDGSRYWQHVIAKSERDAMKKAKNVPKYAEGDKIFAIRPIETGF